MNIIHTLALATALCCATPALAQSNDLPVQLAETELAALRGGQTIVVNNQTLAATTSGNIMGDNVAGNISLADNALSNFNGIGNFVINTGAQNNLQAGMTLTVTVQP